MDQALSLGKIGIPMPAEIPESLTPLVDIIPAQLFSYYLTLAKGFDPDKSVTINKVTETR